MLKDLTYIHGCVLVIAFAGQVRVANMHNLLEINAMQHRSCRWGRRFIFGRRSPCCHPVSFACMLVPTLPTENRKKCMRQFYDHLCVINVPLRYFKKGIFCNVRARIPGGALRAVEQPHQQKITWRGNKFVALCQPKSLCQHWFKLCCKVLVRPHIILQFYWSRAFEL